MISIKNGKKNKKIIEKIIEKLKTRLTNIIEEREIEWTPLRLLVSQRNRFEELKEILEKEKEIEEKLLFYSVKNNCTENLNLLLDKKLNVNAKDESGKNLFWHCSFDHSSFPIWKILLNRNCSFEDPFYSIIDFLIENHKNEPNSMLILGFFYQKKGTSLVNFCKPSNQNFILENF
jgi:hypothetical protein